MVNFTKNEDESTKNNSSRSGFIKSKDETNKTREPVNYDYNKVLDLSMALNHIIFFIKYIWRRQNIRAHILRFLMICIVLTRIPIVNFIFHSFFMTVYRIFLSTLGTTLGVGMGLGLAAFVHDELDRISQEKREVTQKILNQKNVNVGSKGRYYHSWSILKSRNKNISINSRSKNNEVNGYYSINASNHKQNNYFSLMESAGYTVPKNIMRGQIFCPNNDDLNINDGNNYNSGSIMEPSVLARKYTFERDARIRQSLYHFPTGSLISNPESSLFDTYTKNGLKFSHCFRTSKGYITFQKMWPNLPNDIQRELGIFIDYILRDYVVCWYASVDDGLVYEDEKKRRERLRLESRKIMREESPSSMMRVNLEEVNSTLKGKNEKERMKKSYAMKGMCIHEKNENTVVLENSIDNGKSYTYDKSLRKSSGNANNILNGVSDFSVINNPRDLQKKKLYATSKPDSSVMVLSTYSIRTIPFIEILYKSLASIFGNLSTSILDNVNLAELFMVQFLNILKLNIKTYRELRHIALQKMRRRNGIMEVKVDNIEKIKLFDRKLDNSEYGYTSVISKTHNVQRDTDNHKGMFFGEISYISRRDIRKYSKFSSIVKIKGDKKNQTKTNNDNNVHVPYLLNETPMIYEHKSLHKCSNSSKDTSGIYPPTSDTPIARNQRMSSHHFHHDKIWKTVSEIALVREYLMAGKLHPAITFGMDVSSLLFADPYGKDCPLIPNNHDNTYTSTEKSMGGIASDIYDKNGDIIKDTIITECRSDKIINKDIRSSSPSSLPPITSTSKCSNKMMPTFKSLEDTILEKRLFGNSNHLLYECEKDYNRYLAHRLCRVLLSECDFSNPIIRSMSIELMATCILCPMMELFCPDVINGWIIKGLEKGKFDSENVSKMKHRIFNTDNNVAHDQKIGGCSSSCISNAKSDMSATRTTASFEKSHLSTSDHHKLRHQTDRDIANRLALGDYTEHTLKDECYNEGDEGIIDEIDNVVGDGSINLHLDDSWERLSSTSGGELDVTEVPIDEIMVTNDDTKNDNSVIVSSSKLSFLSDHEQPSHNPSLMTPRTEELLPLLTITLVKLQFFINFDDARSVCKKNEEHHVAWEDKQCREVVCKLVLVIEATLIHGVYNKRLTNDSESATTSFILVLMEMTNTLEALEDKVLQSSGRKKYKRNKFGETGNRYCKLLKSLYEENEENICVYSSPSNNEVSTLRTLIAAWLHTGIVYRIFLLLLHSEDSVLKRYYNKNAFLRNEENVHGFVEQLRCLNGVDIMVDTMSVLVSPRLDLAKNNLIIWEVDILEEKEVNRESNSQNRNNQMSYDKKVMPLATNIKSSTSCNITNNTPAVFRASAKLTQPLRDWGNKFDNPLNAGKGMIKGVGINKKRFVLSSRTEHQVRMAALGDTIKANFENKRKQLSRLVRVGHVGLNPNIDGVLQPSSNNCSSDFRIPSTLHLINNPSSISTEEAKFVSLSTPSLRSHNQHEIASFTHLDFHSNKDFSRKHRNDRERRTNSFLSSIKIAVTPDMVCRCRSLMNKHFKIHQKLHYLAKHFYSHTNTLKLETLNNKNKNIQELNTRTLFHDGVKSKKNDSMGHSLDSNSPHNDNKPFLFSLETITIRRKVEVPDDHSSFLLRAQPRQLQAISFHRDQLNHKLSYKCFLAYFEEPLLHWERKDYRGARLQQPCYLRYYPSDRTASISVIGNSKSRTLDPGGLMGSLVEIRSGNTPYLSKEFQEDRFLCHKACPKGSEGGVGSLTGSILTKPIMDVSDFNSLPRSGKAAGFVYRLSLYERPVVEIAGRKFVVQDSSYLGPHRADASSFEISDASLSFMLISYGQQYLNIRNSEGNLNSEKVCCLKPGKNSRLDLLLNTNRIQFDPNNGPVIWIKRDEISSHNQKSDNPLSPLGKKLNVNDGRIYFRTSFIRAALLITSLRQEAQLQCLLSCTQSGSIKNTTNKRNFGTLRHSTLCLLDYATSKNKEKESIVLNYLKLGSHRIDRKHLSGSGILNPRHPTILRKLKVTVESALQMKSCQNIDLLSSTQMVLYKIRCAAITQYVGVEDNACGYFDLTSDHIKPNFGDFFREEWVVLRSFRDFTVLHKHLKSQVSVSELSVGTGSKIVEAATGLATAAFTIGHQSAASMHTRRNPLIPSLAQATKVGALGATRRNIEKRRCKLGIYLNYLLSSKNLLNKCPELLRFVGANDPLPAQVKIGVAVKPDFIDSLGRRAMSKKLLTTKSKNTSMENIFILNSSGWDNYELYRKKIQQTEPNQIKSGKRKDDNKRIKNSNFNHASTVSISSRIERVTLVEVRNSIFDLIRVQFDLDNASFFRSRLISALKTMSFAITSNFEFKKTLLELHLNYASGKSVASYIKFIRDTIWPDGVIFQRSPNLSDEEKEDLQIKSKVVITEAFPEQLKKILGKEILDDGLNILHEMLQNRIILKSMAYMFMDAIIIQTFPELGDILSCTQVLNCNKS